MEKTSKARRAFIKQAVTLSAAAVFMPHLHTGPAANFLDTYNYEKGKSATITFNWSDKNKTLSVSNVKESFPGMLTSRTFNVVLVNETNGTGEAASTNFNKTINYKGTAVAINL